MDKTESMYNHAKQDTQSSSAVGAIDTEEVVDSIKKKPTSCSTQHRFTRDGKPICDRCHEVGHIKKRCDKRWKKEQNRFVYCISEEDCVPVVVSVGVSVGENKCCVGLWRDGERHGRKDVTPGFVPALSYSNFVGD